jgi:hypothetical protein
VRAGVVESEPVILCVDDDVAAAPAPLVALASKACRLVPELTVRSPKVRPEPEPRRPDNAPAGLPSPPAAAAAMAAVVEPVSLCEACDAALAAPATGRAPNAPSAGQPTALPDGDGRPDCEPGVVSRVDGTLAVLGALSGLLLAAVHPGACGGTNVAVVAATTVVAPGIGKARTGPPRLLARARDSPPSAKTASTAGAASAGIIAAEVGRNMPRAALAACSTVATAAKSPLATAAAPRVRNSPPPEPAAVLPKNADGAMAAGAPLLVALT